MFECHTAGKVYLRLDTSSLSQDTAKCSMPDKGHLFPMAMSSTFAWVSGAGMQAAGCGRPKAALQEAAAGTVLSLKVTEGREQPAPALCEAHSPLSHRGLPKHILGGSSLLRAVVLKRIKTG